jgi:hypothetical protein
MCWYSAEHAGHNLQAEAGQRLVIRKVHGSSWAVQEADLEKPRPTPVCLVDQTRVLFRFSEHEQTEQTGLAAPPECEAVFRMLSTPKRDVFQFLDGREVEANSLPSHLLFDVLEIPGKEELSALLKHEHAPMRENEPAKKRESLLERALALF